MKQLLNVMSDILNTGNVKTDRTGTGTISKFGGMMKFNIQHGHWCIPTTRKVAHNKIAEELEWMIKGMISVKWLNDQDNKIWNSWAGSNGTIGPMYGEQWRNWNAGVSKLTAADEDRLMTIFTDKALKSEEHGLGLGCYDAVEVFKEFLAEKTKPYEQGGRGGTDQLQYVIDELNLRPDSRRICVNVWHAGLLPDGSMSPAANADAGNMALAPCHSMWQVETSVMSDIEILRQAYPKADPDDTEYVTALDMQNQYDLDVVGAYITVQLHRFGLIALKEGRPFLNDVSPENALMKIINHHTGLMPAQLQDRNLVVTEEGQKVIDEYKAAGRPTRKLSLLCYARSQDTPLGTVYNVGMYSLLAHQLAAMTNMVPWEYTHLMGDYHIYSNQVDAVNTQLNREPMKPPRVIVDPTIRNISDFQAKNIQVFYESHPAIKFPMAAV